MSTRSLIALKTKEGKVRFIYCHSDGYLGYNGMILNDYYKLYSRVEKLLNLGDISLLGTDPSVPLEESQDIQTSTYKIQTACKDYYRLNGELYKAKEVDFKEFNKLCQQHYGGCEYVYYFTPNKNGDYRWLYKKTKLFRKEDEYGYQDFYYMCGFKELTQRAIDLEGCMGWLYHLTRNLEMISRYYDNKEQADKCFEDIEEAKTELNKTLTPKQYSKAVALYQKDYAKARDYLAQL